MSHYLVGIQGDALRTMGLLANAGIQNLVAAKDPTQRVTARVSADNPESARGRVLAAFFGEPFTVEPAYVEG